MKTTNIFTRVSAILLVVLTVFTMFSTTAFAATSSSGKRTQTITV